MDLQELSWRVPGGTRTHDIQNHNLIPAPLEIPLFMRKVGDIALKFAPILRRISTIIALTLLFYLLICLSALWRRTLSSLVLFRA